jgi:hypothetical protein
MDPEGSLYDDESAEQLEHPVVGAAAATTTDINSWARPINGWRLASQIVVIMEESFKTVYFFSSNFYYYNLAKSFFKLITTVFTMIDHVGRLNIIVPTPAWNRYRTNA